jgi:uncharacterized protein YycO
VDSKKFLLDTAKYGDLLASARDDIGGFVVRWWFTSDISHLSCCIGDGWAIDALPNGGVQSRSILNYAKQRWVLLRLKPEWAAKITDDARIKSREWLESCVGKKYDWPGVLGFPLHTNLQDRGRFYCSELVKQWYRKMDIKVIERSKKFIGIQPLFCSPAFFVVNSNWSKYQTKLF